MSRSRRWLRAGLYAAVLLGISTLQMPQGKEPLVPHLDKAVHVTLYAPLGALLRAATGE